MKLNIKKDVLNEKLNIVSKAISSKNIIPVLSGIKMDLKNEGLFLTASNDEIAIETFIDSNNIYFYVLCCYSFINCRITFYKLILTTES